MSDILIWPDIIYQSWIDGSLGVYSSILQDTITGFLLAGVGNVDLRRKTNYLIVDSKTTVKQIEEAFKEFTARQDVAIVMISQYVANMIKFLVDSYNNPILAILEIPSKDHPYDPTHDSVLSRVKYFFSDFPILCTMLVDDIGDVTITNDGAVILKMLYVEHPAAKVEG
ncbi:V-type proton ATPase subunit F [Camellia lanceoleosa]|uniref:V-type proton ATPase subunit F n=1 Tax=Camellia lanceoleosa TaxID=1840588 RepID=A0ACC0J032_9ERIC|nr:V-type proton ATPase subunit F [Camellia lanceoleosa]